MENLTLRAVCPEDRDDEAIYFMLQHLGRKENGFDNPGNALTRAQFPSLIDQLVASAIVGGLPSGQPAETVFWLYHGQRVIGFSRLRHGLDDFHQRIGGHIGFGIRRDCRRQGYGRALLGLTLAEARRVGLATVLLTCTPGNLASRRIIEIHGGQLETGNDSDRICRYRINQ